MKQQQSYDQKKGSADRCATGEKHGMPGGQIGRGSMSAGSSAGMASSRSSQSGRGSGGNADYGGSEGNSRERKSARSGSDSNGH